MKTRAKSFSVIGMGLALFYFSSCTHLIYQPDRNLYLLPKRIGIKALEYSFQSKDGTTLYAWKLFQRLNPKTQTIGDPEATVLQFHGNAENLSSHYLALSWLVDHGMDVIVFDYRGYGKSQGEPNPKGVYEDALAALDFAYQDFIQTKSKRFVVVGSSLGGAVMMRSLYDFKFKDKINLVVMDSTFLSYKKVARTVLASRWFTWPFAPLGGLLISDEYEAGKSLESYTGDLLVLHDKRDNAVAFELGQEIYDRAKTNKKEIWTSDLGRHADPFHRDQKEMRKKFVSKIYSL